MLNGPLDQAETSAESFTDRIRLFCAVCVIKGRGNLAASVYFAAHICVAVWAPIDAQFMEVI